MHLLLCTRDTLAMSCDVLVMSCDALATCMLCQLAESSWSLPLSLHLLFVASQIEAGDIFDSILSNPLYSVAVDFRGEESDSNLCYEIHGESSTFLNLVSDECFSINAQYSAIDGVTGYNKIDKLMIRTSDASDSCIDIFTKSEDDCESAFVRSGTSFNELSRRYRRNGVQVDFADASIEILLPCRRYRGGGIKVTVTCLAKYENPRNREFLPVKNLYVEFNRAKLLESTNPLPHGLLGELLLDSVYTYVLVVEPRTASSLSEYICLQEHNYNPHPIYYTLLAYMDKSNRLLLYIDYLLISTLFSPQVSFGISISPRRSSRVHFEMVERQTEYFRSRHLMS